MTSNTHCTPHPCLVAGRLRNLEVRTGNLDPTIGFQAGQNALCAYSEGPHAPGANTIRCAGTVAAGRFISLQLMNVTAPLHVCEVQWAVA
jgi:hypothetical protein